MTKTKQKTILICIAIPTCLAIAVFSYHRYNIQHRAYAIQQIWNDKRNDPLMTMEQAISVSENYNGSPEEVVEKRENEDPLYAINHLSKVYRDSTLNVVWNAKMPQVYIIIDELIENIKIIRIGIKDSTTASLSKRDNITSRLQGLWNNEKKGPKEATTIVMTGLINELIPKINSWNSKHPEGLPLKAKNAANKLLNIQGKVKSL